MEHALKNRPFAVGKSKRAGNPSRPAQPTSFATLQRTAGNAAIGAMLRAGTVRTKLRVSQPGDPAEREADRVAYRVVQARRSGAAKEDEAPCSCGGTCDSCSRKAASSQSGGAPQSPGIGPLVLGPARSLPSGVQSDLQPHFGTDLASVRVHDGPEADSAARSIDALAFTIGPDIAFARGRFAPHTTQGGHLLAHELAHVEQGSGQTDPAAPIIQRKIVCDPNDREMCWEENDSQSATSEFSDSSGGVVAAGLGVAPAFTPTNPVPYNLAFAPGLPEAAEGAELAGEGEAVLGTAEAAEGIEVAAGVAEGVAGASEGAGLLGILGGALATGALIGGAIASLFYATPTAPAWLDEGRINPITGTPFQTQEEFDSVRRMTPEQINEAKSRAGINSNTQAQTKSSKCRNETVETLNKEMHKSCNQKRKCSEQEDDCASATAKVAAGYGCVRGRTELQQKCFSPGDPGYQDHMEKIAQESASLRNCLDVQSKKCN